MKPSPKMQEVITELATRHGLDLSAKGAHIRLEMPHYERLVVEVLHEHLVSVAHVFEAQPGLLVADPGIVFFTGYSLWVPVEVNQWLGGYRVYVILSDHVEEMVFFQPGPQADLAGFAEMWAANLVGQGWLQDGILHVESYPF